MNNNIFLKNKIKSDGKYNPDVVRTYNQANNIRDRTKYKFSNEYYKTITNKSPQSVQKQDDLKIDQDDLKKGEMTSRLNNTIKSRNYQDNIMKQQFNKNNYNKNLNNFHRVTRQKKILEQEQPHFNEIKQEKNQFFQKMQNQVENNKKKYADILASLKNSGIN